MPCRSGSPHEVLKDGAELGADVALWHAVASATAMVIATTTPVKSRRRCLISTSQLHLSVGPPTDNAITTSGQPSTESASVGRNGNYTPDARHGAERRIRPFFRPLSNVATR